VHWGIDGADRWLNTTPATVFGFLAVQAFVCLLLAGLAWGLLNWSRRISTAGAGAAAERHFRRRIVQLSIVCEYFLACPAWFALFQPAAAAMNVWGLALATAIVGFTVSLMRGGRGRACWRSYARCLLEVGPRLRQSRRSFDSGREALRHRVHSELRQPLDVGGAGVSAGRAGSRADPAPLT
jgi:hypothetical protein